MVVGYHHLRKHPYIHILHQFVVALSRLSRLCQRFRSSAVFFQWFKHPIVEIPKNQGFHTSQVVRISSIKGTGRFQNLFWAMFVHILAGKECTKKKMNHIW